VNAPPLYGSIGSEGLYSLSWEIYQLLGQSRIAEMFPKGEELKAASERQAEFLIGILGGPPLYMQKHGHPRMRARHLPFRIDEAARQEWLRCFRTALDDGSAYGLSGNQAAELMVWIEAFSGWMVNTEG
jgi:hemoglobin